MTVSSEIEKRIDDSSSTDARKVREPQLTFMPSVETVIGETESPQAWCGAWKWTVKKQKGGLSPERPALM
ncbi:hypothetical protein [Polaromonas sp. CG9_12]|nr:hypothetical protein [Polaromonas sp. CG9_12]